MRAGAIVTGVLGLGTALVFAVAAITASMFPNGTVVGSGFNGPVFDRGFGGGGIAVPVPAPAIDVAPNVIVRGGDGLVAPNDFAPLPGDIVLTDPPVGIEVTPAP